MKLSTDADTPPNNKSTQNPLKTSKLKTLTANVNGLNNITKRHKIFSFLKINKIDIGLLQETHSTKITEKQW